MNTVTPEEVIKKFREVVEDLTDSRSAGIEISPEMSIRDDFGLQSVDLLELGFEIEKHWDISLNDTEFRSLNTVQDVIDRIITKSQKAVDE